MCAQHGTSEQIIVGLLPTMGRIRVWWLQACVRCSADGCCTIVRVRYSSEHGGNGYQTLAQKIRLVNGLPVEISYIVPSQKIVGERRWCSYPLCMTGNQFYATSGTPLAQASLYCISYGANSPLVSLSLHSELPQSFVYRYIKKHTPLIVHTGLLLNTVRIR